MFRRSKKTERRCEPDEVREARRAAEQAAAQRRRVEEKAPEAQKIGSAIRDALERNHFGESIELAWTLRRGNS